MHFTNYPKQAILNLIMNIFTQSVLTQPMNNFEPVCYEGVDPRLEVAFTLDEGFWGSYSHFLPIWADHVMQEISEHFPQSKFALTTFADWDENAKPTDYDYEDEEDLCYTVRHNMTTDRKNIVAEAHDVDIRFSPNKTDNMTDWLAALVFTAADSQVGWSEQPENKNRPVYRIVMVGTNQELSQHNSSEGRRPPQGDGTDSCKNSLPPTYRDVDRIVKDKNVFVVMLLMVSYEYPDIADRVEEHFERMNVPYKIYYLPDDEEEEADPEPDKVVEEDFKRKSEQIVRDLRKVFKTECEDPDPWAYNILGL